MAPEQMTNGRVGPSADWYAFGIITHLLSTGRLPAEGRSMGEILAAKQAFKLPKPFEFSGTVDDEIWEVLQGSLEVDPDQRRLDLSWIASWAES